MRAVIDPETLGQQPTDRKVKGIIHWVSAEHAVPVAVRLYDRLFNVSNPTADKDVDFRSHINPDSLVTLTSALAEPYLKDAASGARFQFERRGYYIADAKDSQPGAPVFNRIVSLRDTWAKLVEKGAHD